MSPAPSFVIPAGQEAIVTTMLGARDPLPDGYVWAGAAIEPTYIRARFESKFGAPIALRLEHPSNVSAPDQTTAKFALVLEGQSNGPFLRAIAERIRAHEEAFTWKANVPSESTSPPDISPTWVEQCLSTARIPFTHAREVAYGSALMLVLMALALRRVPRLTPPVQQTPNAPRAPARLRFVLLVGIALVAWRLALELRFFLLDYDDFDYLLRAIVDPWRPDDSMRILSTSVLFRAGWLFESKPWFFMTASAAAFVAMLASLALFVRQVSGVSSSMAVMAAVFWGLSPAPLYLLSWAAGFQQLLGMALLFLSLSSAIVALRADTRHSLISAVTASMAFCAVGTFVKFPLMLLLPPTLLILGWRVLDPRPRLRRTILCTAFVFSTQTGLMFLAHPSSTIGEFGKVGVSRWSDNLVQGMQGGISAAEPLCRAMFVVFVAYVFSSFRGPERLRILRQTLASLRERLGQMRIGRMHGFAFASIFFCIWLAPFLANQHYFAGYYLSLPAAALAIGAALFCSTLLAKPPSIVAGLLALVVSFPTQVLSKDRHQERRERIANLLPTLAHAIQDKPHAEQIVLMADCHGDGTAEHEIADDLRVFVESMSGQAAIRWASHRHQITVLLAKDTPSATQPVLVAHICRDLPIQVELRR